MCILSLGIGDGANSFSPTHKKARPRPRGQCSHRHRPAWQAKAGRQLRRVIAERLDFFGQIEASEHATAKAEVGIELGRDAARRAAAAGKDQAAAIGAVANAAASACCIVNR